MIIPLFTSHFMDQVFWPITKAICPASQNSGIVDVNEGMVVVVRLKSVLCMIYMSIYSVQPI
ncbi:hypothetical protein CY34DRAFT_181027 [Suillus luteus UH-Slu-Lm8-n1]|uniref:Uncharacterized protein n=1 Tax=Suillus luteus UH-Slu-Lm8-n1 TaxID=930992 RepID=A0A0C9ZVK7_9AGAM|nr:hypothetical protein CY34DRAFT_181027 [Suillus luteus UH-Slu-Lm8-n1]